MPRTDDELVTALQERIGNELRVVGQHDGDSWTIEFIREDIQNDYEADALDDIVEDLVFFEVGGVRQEDLYELGSLRATMRLFEDGLVVHIPTGEQSGYLVSLDDDADVVGRNVVRLVRRAVE